MGNRVIFCFVSQEKYQHQRNKSAGFLFEGKHVTNMHQLYEDGCFTVPPIYQTDINVQRELAKWLEVELTASVQPRTCYIQFLAAILPSMASLRQSEMEALECSFYNYAKSRFKLSARVHLSHLVFETGFKRRMDQRRNVCRLEQILKTQGCHRLMKESHVSVIVPKADWQHRVRPRSGNGILPSLEVDLDYGLRALDHENLIVAARNTLGFNNQWWVVDVYVTEDESGMVLFD